MQFSDIHFPSILEKEELDIYLENGWFRMGQSIFTTNFLNFNRQFYSAIWLRIDLKNNINDANFQKIAKLNSKFSFEIIKANINNEHEELYQLYKTGINFSASSSLEYLLFEDFDDSIFDTYQVNLFDNNKLIGCGFFDLGKTSAEGITSFYHPDYKKFSLGKYLIYLKIHFCKENGLSYFYPGYFAPTYHMFDYKLNMCKEALEYLDFVTDKWIPFSSFSYSYYPYKEINYQIKKLKTALDREEIETIFYNYEYYSANMVRHLKNMKLFDYPIFLYYKKDEIVKYIIIYNLLEKKYQLINFVGLVKIDYSKIESDYYGEELLKIDNVVYSSSETENCINFLKQL